MFRRFLLCLDFFHRELEQKYLDQIRELQNDLSCEKEQHLSLTHEFDTKKKMFDTKLTERESKMKEELANIKAVSSSFSYYQYF